MRNQVSMRAGIVRGEEVIRYPADEIRLLGIDHGNVQVVEYLSTDREGPPQHAHAWDEIEIVIDGEVEFTVGDQTALGGPGTVQFLPANVPHSVRVPAGRARLIYVTIGPPYDGFAREMARLQKRGAPLPEIAQTAARFGVTLA
jgi:quercetin dioxygenase-like cupin family protein